MKRLVKRIRIFKKQSIIKLNISILTTKKLINGNEKADKIYFVSNF